MNIYLSVISHEYDSSHFGTLRVMAQKKDQVIRYGSEVRVGLAQDDGTFSPSPLDEMKPFL
jgi:hypothetical protein